MGTRLVYSSDSGRVQTPKERRSRDNSGPPLPQAPQDGTVRIWRIKGGRGGKTATVVTGIPEPDIERLAGDLRRLAGAGGGVRDGAIEIQGDHRDRLLKKLTDLGYRAKLAGG